jgi:hypothetical protein
MYDFPIAGLCVEQQIIVVYIRWNMCLPMTVTIGPNFLQPEK